MNGHPIEVARACVEQMFEDDLASQRLGIAIKLIAPGQIAATMRVREDMVNGHAICHGGYVFTLADTAFAFACNCYDRVAVAAGATIEFVEPAHAGDELTAMALETHRKGRSGVYDVRVTRGQGDLIAVFRGRSVALDRPLLK